MTKIKCVIMDWAGTTVDYGCFAPLNAFLKVFSEEKGIEITYRQAREPMGLLKIDHIRSILTMPEVDSKFKALYKRNWNMDDVNEMYKSFERHLFASLRNFTTPMPGVIDTVEKLRDQGIVIGSTTGYTKRMMDVVRSEAAAKGYVVDNLVTSDEVPAGRPAPYMIYQNMIDLGISFVEQVIKVGDTIADIKEGKNAKVYSVGIIVGSNEMGMTEKEYNLLPEKQKLALKDEVRIRMLYAGADFVLDTISDLPLCIEKINEQKINEQSNYLLLTPGPLSTTLTVRQAMLQDWCTWDKDYNEGIVTPIRRTLLDLVGVQEPEYTAILLQGSGTYSVEAVIGATVKPTDRLLIIANGAYGRRLLEIATYYKLDSVVVSLHETEPVTAEVVKEALDANPGITHFAMVHCETTTGILNPLEDISRVVRGYPVTFIVDAMSSFGGIPIDMKAYGIDFLISSANKCIQGVPGFGFIIALRSKLEQCKGNARSLSLDLYDQWETMEKGRGKWRYTSPTHVVRAFSQALSELKREGGVESRFERYRKNNRLLIEGMRSLGFTPLLSEKFQSPIISSFLYPSEDFCFNDFYESLKKKGFVIYPGKISDANTFRIGNIGNVQPDDIRRLLVAICDIKSRWDQYNR